MARFPEKALAHILKVDPEYNIADSRRVRAVIFRLHRALRREAAHSKVSAEDFKSMGLDFMVSSWQQQEKEAKRRAALLLEVIDSW